MSSEHIRTPLELVKKRIQNPLEFRDSRTIGLSQIVGTHGTSVDAILRLVRDGQFSGGVGDSDLKGSFHVTPNVYFKGWKKSEFAREIYDLSSASEVFPIDVSVEYAYTNPESRKSGGVVIGFDYRIMPLVRAVDMDDVTNEPEAVLWEAPSYEAVRTIYPLDEFSLNSLSTSLKSLR